MKIVYKVFLDNMESHKNNYKLDLMISMINIEMYALMGLIIHLLKYIVNPKVKTV